MLELLLQTGLNALYSASYISLVAVGLVLIFGVMGIVNFAHGELFMVGAYVVVALYSNFHMPFVLVAALALIFVGAIGLLMERTMFRPLRDNPLGGLVASIGFLMILQALASMTFGVRMAFVPPVSQEVIEFSDKVRLPLQRLYVILAAVGFPDRAVAVPDTQPVRLGAAGPARRTPRRRRCRASRSRKPR